MGAVLVGVPLRVQRRVYAFGRLAHGNQQQLAEALGVSPAYVSQVAAGTRTLNPIYYDATAQALGISVEELVTQDRRILPVSHFVVPDDPRLHELITAWSNDSLDDRAKTVLAAIASVLAGQP